MRLSQDHYLDDDVVHLAKWFLGKILVSNIDGQICSGIIIETEAYAGITDKASHAYGDRKSTRTDPMYLMGGHAYIYLIYGMYSLFNIVTGPAGEPHAVLIRALWPLEGIKTMERRRGIKTLNKLCDGPGKLSKALGIHYSLSGESLLGDRIWLEDRGIEPETGSISIGPRINIDYAEEDASQPYRFLYKHQPIT